MIPSIPVEDLLPLGPVRFLPGGRSFLLCVAGPHQGRQLFNEISTRINWKSWFQANPNSLVMLTK
jgi:hypothetical protein